jgi:hypothetical protein
VAFDDAHDPAMMVGSVMKKRSGSSFIVVVMVRCEVQSFGFTIHNAFGCNKPTYKT